MGLYMLFLSFFHCILSFLHFSPSSSHSAKSKLNQQIDEQINNKIKQRDQMLGRLPQQGWLRLRLNSSNDTTGQEELIFSPIEQESSFFSSENESEIGKRENYQTNYEKVRSVIIDSMADTQEMRLVIHQELEVVMSKLASMKQFTTTNGAADLFAQFNRGKRCCCCCCCLLVPSSRKGCADLFLNCLICCFPFGHEKRYQWHG